MRVGLGAALASATFQNPGRPHMVDGQRRSVGPMMRIAAALVSTVALATGAFGQACQVLGDCPDSHARRRHVSATSASTRRWWMGRLRTRSVPPAVAAASVARPTPRPATWRTCAACRTAQAESAAQTAAVAEERAATVREAKPAMLTGSAAARRRLVRTGAASPPPGPARRAIRISSVVAAARPAPPAAGSSSVRTGSATACRTAKTNSVGRMAAAGNVRRAA